jgi:hypothetical protein
MMKRFTLALRILLGQPLRGIRVGEDYFLEEPAASEFDYSESPPFDLVFRDLAPEAPPVAIRQADRFRALAFRTTAACDCCGAPTHWLVLEFRGARRWQHLLTLHERNLPLLLAALDSIAEAILPGVCSLPRVTVGGTTYVVDARLRELRDAENPHERITFLREA